MKALFEKKVNKILIGTIIGTAILGFGGYGMSPKGRKFFSRLKDKLKSGFGFFRTGWNEMFKSLFKFKK